MGASAAGSGICLPSRLESAARHVDRGEWFSGVAIAANLKRCAERQGCPDKEHCAGAASDLLCEIRSRLSAG